MFWFEKKFFLAFCARFPTRANETILILLLSDSRFFRVMQAVEAETGRRWDIPLRTLHQKWSQLFYVSNQKLDEKSVFEPERPAIENVKVKREK